MPCETKLKPKQTISARAAELKLAATKISAELTLGRVQAKIGPTGAIAFTGIEPSIRDGLTDACIYRRLMATGSATAKAALARAELLAGRSISKQTIAVGIHSHDGGQTWHNKG